MDPDGYELRVDISIRNHFASGSLQLSDSVMIPNCSFADMADILRGFHELAQSVKAAKEIRQQVGEP